MSSFAVIFKRNGEKVSDTDIANIRKGFRYHHGVVRVLTPLPNLVFFVQFDPVWEDEPKPVTTGDWKTLNIGRGQILPNKSQSASCPFVLTGASTGFYWDENVVSVLADASSQRAAWYFKDSKYFLCASEPRILLGHPNVSKDPDFSILAERLAFSNKTPHQSLYRDLRAIPGGKALVVRQQSLTMDSWFDYDVNVVKKSCDEWAYDIFKTSTSVMRSHIADLAGRPYALTLSGGLDSSVIAGMLAREHCDSFGTAAMLRYPGLPCDESTFQRSVLEQRKFSEQINCHRPFEPETDLVIPTQRMQLPLLRVEPEAIDSFRLLANNGIHECFTGIGGDELFSYIGESLIDLLITGQAGRCAKKLKSDPLKNNVFELLEHLPRFVRVARRKCRYPKWLGDGLTENTELAHDLESPIRTPGFRQLALARKEWIHNSGWTTIGKESAEFTSAELRQEFIMPFQHVDLMRLLYTVPENMRISADDSRYLQRQAYASVLPDALLKRRSKVHFDYRHVIDLRHGWVRDLLSNLCLERERLVNGEVLRQMHTSVLASYERDNRSFPAHASKLWNVIGLEIWWRQSVL